MRSVEHVLLLASLSGKTPDEAKPLIEQAGLQMRVLYADRGPSIRTLEAISHRCNVTVRDGSIISADIG